MPFLILGSGTFYALSYPEPFNYDLAMGRLKSLFKRISRTPDILEMYDATIQEQLRTGIVEVVPDEAGD